MSDKELIKHCTESNALSYNELKEMDQDELDQVFSVCWKDAQYNGGYNIDSLRCYTKFFVIFH